MFKTKYRIVRDSYAGFEVQSWRWWFPIWLQCGFTNTHASVDRAKEWLELYSQREVWRGRV